MIEGVHNLNKLQIINNAEIAIKEYSGQRVVTFKDIDAVHGRPDGTARKRFNDNRERFVDGEDYFKICASEFRTHWNDLPAKATEDVTLITESGYLMLVKSFTDDLAWKVQRELIKGYFRAKEQAKPMSTAQLFAMQVQINLEQEQRMKALEEKTQATQETVQEAFSALSYPTVSRDHWQDETRQKIRRVCFENGLNYQQFTAQTYDELEADARVKLETRVNNQRERMKAGGAKSAEIQAVNKLTVIAADPKLRAIYSAIIQRHSAQLVTERFSRM
jgi:hypothetical protein